MKLNEYNKISILRRNIEEQLKNVPNGIMIKLEKETLERLLFETITLESNNVTIKLPVWSGTFLQKLDLSEVDFEDVSWTLLNHLGLNILFDFTNYDENPLIKQKLENFKNKYDNKIINYSYTNANINLKKSFESKLFNEITITNCNFEGMQFKENVNDSKISIINSNLSNTNLTIPKRREQFLIENSNLSNIDLSSITINGVKSFFCQFDYMINSNLTNTKLNVIFDAKEFKSFIKEEYDRLKRTQKIDYQDVYNEYINKFRKLLNKQLVGCYINGKLVHSKEERNKIKKEKLEECYKLTKNLIYPITDSIQKQSKKSGI